MKHLQKFRVMMMMFVFLALVGVARSGELIVDQKNARADDMNPGTMEAPFKTIQAALDKAQASDSVEVRAGVYHEGNIAFKRGGKCSGGALFDFMNPGDVQWLTLEAYKDEHVVLDGAVTIPADKWERAKGCGNTHWTPFESPDRDHGTNMVFRDGVLILPTLKNTPGANSSLIEAPCDIMPAMPGDAPGDKGYYYDRRQKRLFVNLGGRVPGKDAEVRAAHPDKEIAALEVKGANEGIPGLIALSAGRAK